jgi:hypothetical protein
MKDDLAEATGNEQYMFEDMKRIYHLRKTVLNGSSSKYGVLWTAFIWLGMESCANGITSLATTSVPKMTLYEISDERGTDLDIYHCEAATRDTLSPPTRT